MKFQTQTFETDRCRSCSKEHMWCCMSSELWSDVCIYVCMSICLDTYIYIYRYVSIYTLLGIYDMNRYGCEITPWAYHPLNNALPCHLCDPVKLTVWLTSDSDFDTFTFNLIHCPLSACMVRRWAPMRVLQCLWRLKLKLSHRRPRPRFRRLSLLVVVVSSHVTLWHVQCYSNTESILQDSIG